MLILFAHVQKITMTRKVALTSPIQRPSLMTVKRRQRLKHSSAASSLCIQTWRLSCTSLDLIGALFNLLIRPSVVVMFLHSTLNFCFLTHATFRNTFYPDTQNQTSHQECSDDLYNTYIRSPISHFMHLDFSRARDICYVNNLTSM